MVVVLKRKYRVSGARSCLPRFSIEVSGANHQLPEEEILSPGMIVQFLEENIVTGYARARADITWNDMKTAGDPAADPTAVHTRRRTPGRNDPARDYGWFGTRASRGRRRPGSNPASRGGDCD